MILVFNAYLIQAYTGQKRVTGTAQGGLGDCAARQKNVSERVVTINGSCEWK